MIGSLKLTLPRQGCGPAWAWVLEVDERQSNRVRDPLTAAVTGLSRHASSSQMMSTTSLTGSWNWMRSSCRTSAGGDTTDGSSPAASSNPPSHSPSLSGAQRSGRDTPASVDSIPLEWDFMTMTSSRDLESAVSRTLPSEDEEGPEDKDFYLRGAVGLSGRKELLCV